jgi:hypothetical protein
MLEEFFEFLSRLRSLKQGQLWNEAAGTLDQEFQRLIHTGAEAVASLSETELLARLIQGEPTQVVRDKTWLLTTLLKEAGDVAAARERPEESRACYSKGLHLLLDTLATGEVTDFPEFVPRVEVFVTSLGEAPLPLATQARLMQHYERTGEFGKAEDLLFAMLDSDAEPGPLVDFGIAFYERLQRQGDASLTTGNLPRAELETGLAELRRKGGRIH